MDDIDKQVNGDPVKETPAPPQAPVKEPEQKIDPEVEERKAQLAEIEKAKGEALTELQRIREEKRDAKKASKDDEELPQIDESDPSVKAWDKRIKQEVNPYQQQVEQGKAEIRQFALDRFLADKPALSKDPAKIKELVATYDKLRTATESTTEGVLLDLDKAYAATFHKELLEAARQSRIEGARNDALFSDIAVSRGSTAQTSPKTTPVKLSEDDKAILARWGMTPDEWAKMKSEVKEQ